MKWSKMQAEIWWFPKFMRVYMPPVAAILLVNINLDIVVTDIVMALLVPTESVM